MRKLLTTLLNTPTFSSDELHTILTAQVLMVNTTNSFRSALLNSDGITGQATSHAFITLATLFDATLQFEADINTAWYKAQTAKKKTVYNSDNLIAITSALIPDNLELTVIKKILANLEQLKNALEPLYLNVESNETSKTAAKMDRMTTLLQAALTLKLPPEERPVAFIDHDSQLESQPLLEESENTHEKDTIAFLNEKYAAEQALEIKSIAAEALIEKEQSYHQMLEELVFWFHQQRELILAQQIYDQFRKYKATLEAHINSALTCDPTLYNHYFNEPDSMERQEKIANIADIILNNDLEMQRDEEKPTTSSIKILASNNLTFTKVVANYKVIHDAEKKLLSSKATPAPLGSRLVSLYNDYPAIDRNLQLVKDQTVDQATSGFKSFFRKLWHSITWYFSAAGKNEREFIKSTKNTNPRLFKYANEAGKTNLPAVTLSKPQL